MKKRGLLRFLPYLIVFILLFGILGTAFQNNSKEFTMNQFKDTAAEMEFADVSVSVTGIVLRVEGHYIEDEKEVAFTVMLPKSDENLIWLDEVLNEGENKVTVVDGTEGNIFFDLLISFLPLILMVGLGFLLLSKLNGGQNNKAFEFTKSRAKVEGNIKARFKDVAGCKEEKEEVAEIIDYLKHPRRYADMGARVPKGMLLVGPPGTGKTLLAKACAGEADVPFYSISGSDFVEMFVGAGASRVRDMFKKANQTAPCIVFIDEIDAVGRRRGAGIGGGNDEREQTLNQLLVELDGIQDNKGIVVIAATNRSDVLDPALLRSGRFDREIMVNLPDKTGRQEILAVHAKNKKLDKNCDLESIAKKTPGYSGADLENVLNEAAIMAVRNKRKVIIMEDIDEAIDRVMAGPAKKSKVYSEKEKKRVAYHEAGHTVIGLKLEGAYLVEKVTIIPRGKAGGYNLMTPKEETYFQTKSELISIITGTLGGRVAEEIMFGDVSNGAGGDIQSCTEIARTMVKNYGMSDLGPILYDDRYMEQGSLPYSDEYAKLIDDAVKSILDEALEHARKLIKKHKKLLVLIAETLIEKETLNSEEIVNLEKYGTITNPEEVNKVEEVEEEDTIIEETTTEEETPEEVTNISEDAQEVAAEDNIRDVIEEILTEDEIEFKDEKE